MNVNTKMIWAMLTAACLGVGAGESFAANADASIPQKEVSLAGLDLDRAEGAAILYGRVRAAAYDVCRHLESRQLEQLALWHKCVDQAISAAVAKIDRPALSTYLASKTGNRASVHIAASMHTPSVQAGK
jgi:UrcA family protein